MEYFQSRLPGQTARLNQKLVHVTFFKEGISLPLREQLKFLRSFEPDAAKDSVTHNQCMISRWPEDPVKYALISLAQTHPWHLEGRDVTVEELRLKDGARMLLLRVYEKPPKKVASTAPAQKNESGWFSKLFSRS